MSEPLVGRRVPVVEGKYYPEGLLVKAGDYYGPVSDPSYYSGKPSVWFKLPIADDDGVPESAIGPRLVCSPPHVFTEEHDGTLTIRESILAKGWQGEPDVWHGYLTNGKWQSV